jgi:hypothetical protein
VPSGISEADISEKEKPKRFQTSQWFTFARFFGPKLVNEDPNISNQDSYYY